MFSRQDATPDIDNSLTSPSTRNSGRPSHNYQQLHSYGFDTPTPSQAQKRPYDTITNTSSQLEASGSQIIIQDELEDEVKALEDRKRACGGNII